MSNDPQISTIAEKKIVVISGPPGCGKSSLIKLFLEKHPGKAQFSISSTTRNPRRGEEEGVDYYFTNKDDFKKKIDEGLFIEWVKSYNNYYGTLKQEIVRIVEKGYLCLLDLDVRGTRSLLKIYPNCTTIFIKAPNEEELKRRLLLRNTESREEIERRLQVAKTEFSQYDFYNHIILNEDFNQAYQELEQVLLSL